jgi:hypothetical protein
MWAAANPADPESEIRNSALSDRFFHDLEAHPTGEIMSPNFLATIALALAAQAGGADRLEFMKDSVRVYEMTRDGDRADLLKLNLEPVFRMGRQGAQDIEEGAIFLWTGEAGRPEAAVQVFLIRNAEHPNGIWLHEFTSLSPRRVAAVRDGRATWSPQASGIEFRPVPGAAKPAGSAAQRIRQMREMAGQFRASDNFKAKGWSELRLLPTPIARYGGPDTKVVDGAVFAFVIGTDPEVFLFLEARPGDAGAAWHYALAPMTVYALEVSLRGKAVWGLPDRHPSWDPSKPFYDTMYRP